MNVTARSTLKRAFVRGLAIAAIVLATALVAERIVALAGFNDPMARMFPWAMVAVVTAIIFVESSRPVVDYIWQQVRPDYSTGEDHHTSEEIALQASSVRRRHYLKQLAKTAGGVLFAFLAAVDGAMLILRWETMYPTFQEAFGENAALHYQFITVFMAVMAVVGLALATRAWLNRYMNEDASIIQAMEELEATGGEDR